LVMAGVESGLGVAMGEMLGDGSGEVSRIGG
jgi:hypothetical protein